MKTMSVPEYLTSLLKQSTFFEGVAVHSLRLTPLQGGDINESFLLESPKGTFFLKSNEEGLPGLFRTEKQGLSLLRSGSGFVVPEPLEQVETNSGQYLLLTYLKPEGQIDPGVFAEKLAGLHRQSQKSFGLDHDNYIGSLPQSNTPHENWAAFFAEQRLLPLCRSGVDKGLLPLKTAKTMERILGKWDNLIPPEPPALLHGDLWKGNTLQTHNGPALYDPAVYYGHREMDLSMMQLFGGFKTEVFRQYHRFFPLENGFSERVALHNLYPLLVHLCLFGKAYLGQIEAVLHKHT